MECPELFGTHLLRRGGATHASKSGQSLRMIKFMGHWRSDVEWEYLCASPSEMWDAAAQLYACWFDKHACVGPSYFAAMFESVCLSRRETLALNIQ